MYGFLTVFSVPAAQNLVSSGWLTVNSRFYFIMNVNSVESAILLGWSTVFFLVLFSERCLEVSCVDFDVALQVGDPNRSVVRLQGDVFVPSYSLRVKCWSLKGPF